MQKKDLAVQHPFRSTIEWTNMKLRAVPTELRIVLMTLVLGFITHGFVYANTLFGHDNIHLYASGFNAVRWSSQLFYVVRAGLQLPWVIGLISLLELGIVNVLLTRMFALHRLSTQLLLIVTMITFPSVIAFHNYGSIDLFTGALLFSVLAVYLSTRKGFNSLLLSVVFLTISIATYQAFVCTATTLMLLLLLARLTIRRDDTRAVLLDAIKALVTLCSSIALYYLISIMLTQAGVLGATSYRNQNEMGIFTVSQLIGWIKEAYMTVRDYYISATLNPLPLWVSFLQLTCLAVVAFTSIIRLFRERFFHKPGRLFLALVIVALLPLSINGIQVLNNGLVPHLLMTFAFIAPWWFVLQYGEWLLDQPQPCKIKLPLKKALSILCVALISLNAFYGYILANADYVARKMNYDASISLATRLIDRIENIKGYTPTTPVMIVGNLWSNYASKPRLGFELANNITGCFASTGQAMTYNDALGSTIQWFISEVLSSTMVFVPSNQMDQYMSMEQVARLQSFPENNCYTWIADVLVLKLSK